MAANTVFDITEFNPSLYRFLLKNFKIVWYSSLVFLVSLNPIEKLYSIR